MRLGKVYLVGAGPGDTGLITLKGVECLGRADLVLYDGLVNPLLLGHTQAAAVRTSRTSAPEGRVLAQHEINEQLIAAARAGKTVVRLKGGDPFIFGRGAEEAAALAAAGIPFEVVPGVTAAVATSAYAGISLTHRDCASAVAFVTGHEDPQKPESLLDYRALAAFPGTLVFYMGLHRLPEISQALIREGKPADTPAAVICRGTTPAQRTVVAPLGGLAAAAEKARLHAPSLTIIGECVRQRETIGWFEQKPLFGRRVGVTRPAGQSAAVIARLFDLGAQPVLMPTIEILPPTDWHEVDRTLERLATFDWIAFTSVNGVRSLMGRLWETGSDGRRLGGIKLAAIGEGTSQALAEFHLRADLVPSSFRAEALAEALKPHVAGRHVLWARASRCREILPIELRSAGATLEELVVYRNEDVDQLDVPTLAAIEGGELDWIGLSSPSIARSLARLLSPAAKARLGDPIRLASISPITTAAAHEAGLPIAVEATRHTWNGILDAIIENS
ncbi:MAG: uroporphyrinogen-III C-methyltransferase [Planctomycetaceae bacterium]|nr:uroporphyrinogen-III C-methyltransferase [Planctomycetaceae bacterium]